MQDRHIEHLMEIIRRRREEKAAAKAQSTPAESKRIGVQTFSEILEKRKAEVNYNPFRGPDKRYGGGQRKKKKKEKE